MLLYLDLFYKKTCIRNVKNHPVARKLGFRVDFLRLLQKHIKLAVGVARRIVNHRHS